MLGWAEYTAGNLQGAFDRFAENAQLYRQVGNRLGEAGELANIGDLAMEAGDLQRAAAQFHAAFGIPDATACNYLAPSLINGVGVLAGCLGRHESAIRLIAGARNLYGQFGLTPDPGDGLTERVWQAATMAVGETRVAELDSEPVTTSKEALVALALTELGSRAS